MIVGIRISGELIIMAWCVCIIDLHDKPSHEKMMMEYLWTGIMNWIADNIDSWHD